MSESPRHDDGRAEAEVLYAAAEPFIGDVPAAWRPAAFDHLMDALGRIYEELGVAQPEWLTNQIGPPRPLFFVETLDQIAGAEIMRVPLRHAARRHPGRVGGLARSIGYDKRAFRRFLAGQIPSDRERISDYVQSHRPGVLAHIGNFGLAFTVSELPISIREEGRYRLASAHQAFLSEKGRRAPRWLVDETEWPI